VTSEAGATESEKGTMDVKQCDCDCLKHYLHVYGDLIRTILPAMIDSLDKLRKLADLLRRFPLTTTPPRRIVKK
jgi:hypothetical protein